MVGEVLACVVDGVTPSVASTTAVVRVVADETDVVFPAGVVVVSTTAVADGASMEQKYSCRCSRCRCCCR